jgi:lysophospholipase L1-like esterase
MATIPRAIDQTLSESVDTVSFALHETGDAKCSDSARPPNNVRRLAHFAQPREAGQKGKEMKNIVLIGDSIRMGYQLTVHAELGGWADVWWPDQNGESSVNVLAHLDDWVISRQPDVLHVNCGLHDLKKEFGQDTAAVPLDAYRDNVRTIMTRAKTETDAIVIWALTTPVNHEWHHNNKTFDRFEEDVIAYNRVAAGVANELGIPVNDLYSVVSSAGRDSLLLPDGVHYKPEGYELLGKRVAACVKGDIDTGEQAHDH